MKYIVLLIFFVVNILCSHNSFASGWEDIFESLSYKNTIRPGVQQSTYLYNAYIRFTVHDNDGIATNFGNTDTVDLFIKSTTGNKRLTFSGTKPQLINWAKANAQTLLRIIFASFPEASFGGATNGQLTTQQVLSACYGPLATIRNVDIRVRGQYDFFELGPRHVKARGSSGMISFSKSFISGKHTIGVIMPYRYAKSDDKLDSIMGFFSIMPTYKYHLRLGKNEIEWSINGSVGAVYLRSDLFPKGSGYIEYGGGTGLSFIRSFYKRLVGKVGIHYQYTERDVPDSLVPDELKWVAKAIDDLDAEQDLTMFGGLSFYIIPKKWYISANAYRIQQLQADIEPDYKYQTVVNAYMGYDSKHIHIQLGYKTSFEIKDYDDHSIIASLRFTW